jgi:hypothetical protein
MQSGRWATTLVPPPFPVRRTLPRGLPYRGVGGRPGHGADGEDSGAGG